MADWEGSESDSAVKAKTPAPKAAVVPPKKVGKGKWEGEDEEEDGPVSDWEASSDEDEEKPAPSAPVAAPKKKGTLKAKLAEKEAARAARIAAGEDSDGIYDEDDVLDPREKAKKDRERELAQDLDAAADLFGTTSIAGSSSSELDALLSFQPKTKDDFHKLSAQIIELVIKRHQNAPLYATFLEHHARELAMPLKDVEVRKVASGLTTLANEKQKEQREKASGKKKPKSAAKPALGAAKQSSRLDTSIYEESLDDFGSNADDFM